MCIEFRHDLISRAGLATDKRNPSALLTVSNRKIIMKIILSSFPAKFRVRDEAPNLGPRA
jgi:hypothetical protein